MTNFTLSPTFAAANASQKAELLLRRLGVRRNLVGFDYTVYMSVQVQYFYPTPSSISTFLSLTRHRKALIQSVRNMPLKISAENIRFIYQARRLRLLLPDSFRKNRFITGPMRMSRNEKHPGKAMTIIPMKFCRSFPCTRTRFLV